MTYQNDDKNAVVRHIQELLRTIQVNGSKQVTVPVDGIYGTSTVIAITELQKEFGLPTTGNVDRITYDILYENALAASLKNDPPLPLYLLQNGQSVFKGEKSDVVMIIQIVLNALTVSYDDFPILNIDGVFGSETERAVRRFQMRNNISQSGIIDKTTWNALILNFCKNLENS